MNMFQTIVRVSAGVLALTSLTLHAEEATSLAPNTGFELDADGNGWPDGWATPKVGGSWVNEEGNHFLRLSSPEAGKMVMLYKEIPIPAGTEALEISWKQRVTGLKKGKKPWFDARFLMEFMDAKRERVPGSPGAAATGRDTEGWVEKQMAFLVPEGATTLKFMPCLFLVEAGTFDIDDLVIQPTDPLPVREAIAEAEAKRAQEVAARLAKRQAKAAELLATTGSLIPGGDFETSSGKKEIVEEEGNHFLRLVTTEPGKLTMHYRLIDLPADTSAVELSWKQRVTGLQKGVNPWFDARFLMEWKDAAGKPLPERPPAPYTQKDTKGWEEKSTSFLVPEGAATLVLMPSLFQTKAGTFDIDNLVLKPTDPAPILARKAEAERRAAARYVPDEKPNPAKWPKMLKVVGNRLHDTDGKEVWLQGLNAGGLETLPNDDQPIKSLVVGIDEWKANCVRVPIKEEFWWGKSPYQRDGGAAYRKMIDKMITLAANRGAYVVIDLHRFRAPKKEHAEFWKEFATVYKDHPAVLFDVFNEPHDITWDVWRNGGWVGDKKGVDESAFLSDAEKKKNQGFESVGMQGLVDAVRSTGAKNIIIAGGLFWCNDLSGVVNGYALDDKGGNGIMYSWHTYNWHPGWARILPVAEKYPIFLGEVGADVKKMGFIPTEDQEDPFTWVPDMLGFIQKHKINWTGWCFHPYATPVMISDWDYTPTPFWGEFAKKALSGEQFEMKKMR